MNVDQNAKKGPPCHQKIKCSVLDYVQTSDDQLSDLSNESQLKCEKRPPISSKNKMLIFILRSTSDDWPSNPSDES